VTCLGVENVFKQGCHLYLEVWYSYQKNHLIREFVHLSMQGNIIANFMPHYYRLLDSGHVRLFRNEIGLEAFHQFTRFKGGNPSMTT